MTTGFELGTDGPTRILVGVDGSDTSLRAGAYAAGLARRQGARLVVVFVRTAGLAGGVAATAGAAIQAQDALAREVRDAVAEGATYIGITSEYVERSGNPYREILAVAEQLRVDAIVVGASTQAGHRFVGSLAGRLVKDAAWPVTVVP